MKSVASTTTLALAQVANSLGLVGARKRAGDHAGRSYTLKYLRLKCGGKILINVVSRFPTVRHERARSGYEIKYGRMMFQ